MDLISILPSVITDESHCTDTKPITAIVNISIGNIVVIIITIIIIMFQKGIASCNAKLKTRKNTFLWIVSLYGLVEITDVSKEARVFFLFFFF